MPLSGCTRDPPAAVSPRFVVVSRPRARIDRRKGFPMAKSIFRQPDWTVD
jgi:hypothetical protein